MEPALNCTSLSLRHVTTSSHKEEALRVLQDLCRVSKPADKTQISSVALGVSGVLLSCGLLLSISFFIFTLRFRMNRIVKMSSPNLSMVTLLGSTLNYSSAFLFMVQGHSISMESIVQVRVSLLYIGVTLVFGPLLGKSWRLHRVFTHRVPGKRVIITDMALLGLVAALLFVDMLLLLTWVLSDPVRCVRTASATIRASDRDTSGAVTRMAFCASLHADLWIALLLGVKGILLIYGSYLAGLTNHISSPPVNQSLAIMAGSGLVLVSTGSVFLVSRFFPAWPNLIYGMTSGSILICTTTINCLIFIPQLLQWRQFEEEQSPNIIKMAKYLNSSSKSFRSMYSEDDIYHLLGENASMRRLLTEKNAVIESLQEQVSNAKDKLVKLLNSECGFEGTEDSNGPDPSNTTLDGQQHDTTGEELTNGPIDVSHQQPTPDTTESLNHGVILKQEQTPPEVGADTFGCKSDAFQVSGEDKHESQDSAFEEPHNTIIPLECPTMAQKHKIIPVSRSISLVDNLTKARQQEAWDQLSRRVNYVSSEKLQEILKELSVETLQSCGRPSPRKQRRTNNYVQHETASLSSEGFHKVCLSLSPYMMRRRRGHGYPQRRHYSTSQFSGAVAPPAWCLVNKGGRTVFNGLKTLWDDKLIQAAERKLDIAAADLQYNLPSSLPNDTTSGLKVQDEEDRSKENGGFWVKKLFPEPSESPMSPIPDQRHSGHETQGMVTLSDLRSQTPYTETDSSSSDEAACCCHRPYCDLCLQNMYDSSDSYNSESESCNQPQVNDGLNKHPQPVVNFNEDLKPTFV
ncbi:putative G-protein coupled receptor 156 [Discoglossus pictus]